MKTSFIPKTYKSFPRDKKSGGKRWCWVPNDKLKLQQKMISKLVESYFRTPKYVHAFAKGKSYITNATYHYQNKFWGYCDLKNFFDNMPKASVMKGLRYYHIPENIIRLVDKWCFRYSDYLKREITSQGIPSSPILANIGAFELDNALLKIAINYNMRYSRYADDMTFSSTSFVSKDTQKEIYDAIVGAGFKINFKKKFMWRTQKSKVEINGILVSNNVMTLCKEKRLLFRSKLHHIITGRKELTKKLYNSTMGYFSYVKSVSPDLADKYMTDINRMKMMYKNNKSVINRSEECLAC